jgi:hypothetical protein
MTHDVTTIDPRAPGRFGRKPGLTAAMRATTDSQLRRPGIVDDMASYALNESAVRRARELIEARQYVLDSDWGEVQPNAEVQNSYLERHSWDEYALWHLGLTEGATEGTKARYAFVFGDFRRVHRSGLIACVYRASEWRHKAVELAAHDLLQHLDRASGTA